MYHTTFVRVRETHTSLCFGGVTDTSSEQMATHAWVVHGDLILLRTYIHLVMETI